MITDENAGGVVMDPITQKFLMEFCKSFEISEKKIDTAFESFCNYCCVNKENGIVDSLYSRSIFL